jgi:glycosyltransferase involved in cell wall biosynthesis
MSESHRSIETPMNVPKVSVIIPVFNVEKYLPQCLSSVLSQTLVDIEIICVNDGSTDSSLRILEAFSAKDSRFKIFSIPNSGLPAARNVGLKHIRGEYISFVDSDDWIEADMLESLHKRAIETDVDMVLFTARQFDEALQQFVPTGRYFDLGCLNASFDDTVFNHEKTGKLTLGMNVTAWSKLYKTKFIQRNQISFIEDIIFEDNPFFFSAYLRASRVTLVRKPFYIYRINRSGSLVALGDRRYFDIIRVMHLIEQIFEETNNLKYLEDFANSRIIRVVSRFNQTQAQYKNEFLSLIRTDFKQLPADQVLRLKPAALRMYKNILKATTYHEYYLRQKLGLYQDRVTRLVQTQRKRVRKLNLVNRGKRSSRLLWKRGVKPLERLFRSLQNRIG